MHDRVNHQNPSVLLNLTSSREQRLLFLTLMQIGTHFIAFALQWIGKGVRRERRSAFTTQIDIYQSQRTTSALSGKLCLCIWIEVHNTFVGVGSPDPLVYMQNLSD